VVEQLIDEAEILTGLASRAARAADRLRLVADDGQGLAAALAEIPTAHLRPGDVELVEGLVDELECAAAQWRMV
jgi:hypothetical protein